MKWPHILDQARGHRYATEEDIRNIFADYHDTLHWLAGFLIGEELAPACVVDACTIAQSQTAIFHHWLVHWAARATLHCALQRQHAEIVKLASVHEGLKPVHTAQSPLSPADLQLLIERSDLLRARLDILCRFVLILCGIAKESGEEAAELLGISRIAVEHAYGVALQALADVRTNHRC